MNSKDKKRITRLEDMAKKILLENKDKESPLKEIYKMTSERAKSFDTKNVTKESILEKYKNLF